MRVNYYEFTSKKFQKLSHNKKNGNGDFVLLLLYMYVYKLIIPNASALPRLKKKSNMQAHRPFILLRKFSKQERLAHPTQQARLDQKQ